MAGGWRRVGTEAYRFLAVGGLATVVAFLLFNLLVHGFSTGWEAPLKNQPYLAYAVANLVGMLVSYRGSRSWVFKHRPPRSPDGGRLLFVVINLATMLLPLACLWLSRHVLGLDDPFSDNVAANGIGLFLGMVARFYLFRTLVFQRPVHLADLRQHPMQVFELSELDGPDDGVAAEGREGVSAEARGRSTSGPAPRRAP